MTRIDDIDEAIIAAFQKDGRQSNREIARQLNVSEGTVRQRLTKLQAARAVRFDVLTDVRHAGISFVAFVRLTVAPSRLTAVLDECATVPELFYVAAVTGRYNVMTLIAAASEAHAMRVINEHIGGLHGVLESDVRVVVKTLKNDLHEIVVPDD